MNIIFATGNSDKMKEIREILEGVPGLSSIKSMKEAGLDPKIIEDGLTFEDNAMIKAKVVYKAATEAGIANPLVLADDSGLCIDCLNGEPGIYSARYLGHDTSYDVKNADLIRRVNEAGGDRTARFVCAIAAVFPDGSDKVVRGTVDGEIAKVPAGSNGFGFDPIFFLPDRKCTTAELAPQDKHAISHRGNALRLMRKEIEKFENSYSK
ncbi:MAG: RdgB/HAM1 family non-canonical purine NTP pyrophosphatase [Lachnospiraceae bacterium]|nr:RdgB/HAM1 family non-canonical purine NTP pyrophosphatase [Lachnospiraceae bacterium]